MKKSNVSTVQDKGLREIRERIKQKEVVVFETDKTGHFTADTVPSYEEALYKHVENDTKINKKKVKSLENKCNHHLKQFNRMFCVGATRGLERRVADATTSTNVPPPLY